MKDRKTDRCYAAKHIRIRKAEQKEKVRQNGSLRQKLRPEQTNVTTAVAGCGGDQLAEEVLEPAHHPIHRGLREPWRGN